MTLRTKNQKNHNRLKTPKNKSSRRSVRSDTQTFTHHIRELRRRLFLSAVVGIIVGSLVYNYRDLFLKVVMQPLGSQKLIYLNPAGGFSFIFMVTFYVTLLIVLPFLLYQLYAFIKPAIPRHTRRLSLTVGVVAVILMATGATFGYLFAVPAGLNFLSNFASDYVTPTITADSYLSFVLGYVLGIGMLFELPLLLLFGHWVHPLTPKGLLNSERFVILGAFVAAAVLSPSPDALSQTIIAVPIVVVYQLGVLAVLVSIARTRKLNKKTSTVHADTAPSRSTPLRQASVPPLQKRIPVSSGSFQTKPATTYRKNTSIDGMLSKSSVSSSLRQPRQVAPHFSRIVVPPARSRPTLVVASRRRTINDIRPIRNSILDISH